MSEFIMPSLGADMEDAILLEWKVKQGDYVSKGDIIAEIETVKGDIEVEVFEEGFIQKLLAQPGEKLPVGTVLALINPEENAAHKETPSPIKEPSVPTISPEISPLPNLPSEPKPIEVSPSQDPIEKPIPEEIPEEEPSKKPMPSEFPPPKDPEEQPIPVDIPPPEKEPNPEKERPIDVPPVEEPPTEIPHDLLTKNRVRASPLAKRIAEDLHLNLVDIKGSGEGGIIHKIDVEKYAAELKSKPKEVTQSLRNKKMRKAIASAMSLSNKEIPHYYLEHSIDMKRALEWMKKENLTLSIQQRLLPVALLLKATALALTNVTDLNGYWKAGVHYLQEDVNIGVAISLRGGGLVIPAIHQVNKKGLVTLMENLSDITERARHGKLKSSELTDATITVTNIGERGVEKVFGVIYPPQVAIVGFGKIIERPWAVEDMLTIRPILTVTLAADHRATDGRIGARFLEQVEKYLQEPELL